MTQKKTSTKNKLEEELKMKPNPLSDLVRKNLEFAKKRLRLSQDDMWAAIGKDRSMYAKKIGYQVGVDFTVEELYKITKKFPITLKDVFHGWQGMGDVTVGLTPEAEAMFPSIHQIISLANTIAESGEPSKEDIKILIDLGRYAIKKQESQMKDL